MGNNSVIGKSTPRLESEDKVTGQLEYLEDVTIAGMLHGKILRSSVPHAEVRRVEASRAETFPGVVAVLTGKDVVDNPRYQTLLRAGSQGSDHCGRRQSAFCRRSGGGRGSHPPRDC